MAYYICKNTFIKIQIYLKVTKFKSFYLWLLPVFFCISCGSTRYFFDAGSAERQKELRKIRSSNIFSTFFEGTVSVVYGIVVDAGYYWYPPEQQFQKLKLENTSTDTLYVNMLTDVFWDEENYCDFMDIRIPPSSRCKVMVPVNSNYNLYFSNTPESDDDEMLEIFTGDVKKLSLYPGITLVNDTINLNQ